MPAVEWAYRSALWGELRRARVINSGYRENPGFHRYSETTAHYLITSKSACVPRLRESTFITQTTGRKHCPNRTGLDMQLGGTEQSGQHCRSAWRTQIWWDSQGSTYAHLSWRVQIRGHLTCLHSSGYQWISNITKIGPVLVWNRNLFVWMTYSNRFTGCRLASWSCFTMHVPMCGQGSGQDLLPKAYLEKGPRLGHPSVRVPNCTNLIITLVLIIVIMI